MRPRAVTVATALDAEATPSPERVARARLVTAAALVVLAAGVASRAWPILRWRLWGSDTGEYYYLTDRLVDSGAVSFAYDGWGIVYPYFPGMFVLSGAVHAVTGLDLLVAIQWTVPAVAGAIGLGVLLVTHRATGSVPAALVAGAFAGVSGASVMFTSHAMPGTLGHVPLIAAFLVVIAAREDLRWAWLLPPILGGFVLVHHLSLYFLVGIVAGGAFFREIGSARWDRAALRVEVPVVLACLGLAGWWWLGVSEPFRNDIVGFAFGINPFVTAGAFVLALLALPALVVLRRRLFPSLRWRPRTYRPGAAFATTAVFIAAFYGLMWYFTVYGMPGGNIPISTTTMTYLVPVAPVLMLAFLGAGAVKFTRDGLALWGWNAAILASLAFASATGSKVLFPFRHVDYLAEAIGALAGVGFLAAHASASGAARPRRARRAVVAITVAALVAGGLFAYPPRAAIGGFEEAMTQAELDGVRWADANLPDGTTIAADHRVSSLLFGFAGLAATWDFTPRTYHAESWEDVFDELAALNISAGVGRRIDYVLLSPAIREGVTLVQWEPSLPMSDRAWRKFLDDPEHFEIVYVDASSDVYVLRVRWEADARP